MDLKQEMAERVIEQALRAVVIAGTDAGLSDEAVAMMMVTIARELVGAKAAADMVRRVQ